eukprot:jgi/Botrbrau1/15941/Bobra.0260s0003.1
MVYLPCLRSIGRRFTMKGVQMNRPYAVGRAPLRPFPTITRQSKANVSAASQRVRVLCLQEGIQQGTPLASEKAQVPLHFQNQSLLLTILLDIFCVLPAKHHAQRFYLISLHSQKIYLIPPMCCRHSRIYKFST